MFKTYERNGWLISRNIQPSRNVLKWRGYHEQWGFCYADTLRGMFELVKRGAINPYIR